MRGPGCRCQQAGGQGVPHVETFRCLVCGQPVDPSRSFVCPQYRPDTAGACRLCYQLAAAHTYAARALETCPDEGGPATHITWDQEGRRLVDGELGAEHLTTGRVCPCALAVPLDGHDRDPAQWAVVEQVVADLGELFLITVGDRHFRVSRYCVALHGVRAETIGYYGFEEIGG